jgi:hypothetical protein
MVELLFGYFLCSPSVFLGFGCGALAFCASFSGIEVLSRRVLSVGSIAGGVGGGVFWALFKFFAPLLFIYYACWRDFSILAVFVGLLFGLINTSAVLVVNASK